MKRSPLTPDLDKTMTTATITRTDELLSRLTAFRSLADLQRSVDARGYRPTIRPESADLRELRGLLIEAGVPVYPEAMTERSDDLDATPADRLPGLDTSHEARTARARVTKGQRAAMGDETADVVEDRRMDGRMVLVDWAGPGCVVITWPWAFHTCGQNRSWHAGGIELRQGANGGWTAKGLHRNSHGDIIPTCMASRAHLVRLIRG